jgi:ribosomal-protein-alanine N-acetyltransferase
MTGMLRLVPWAGEEDIALPRLAPAAAAMVAVLTEIPRAAPWGCYLGWVANTPVGVGAFKAAPDDEGTVEIAYATFPPHAGQGHATAMIAALADIARSGGAAVVIAHTLPAMNASGRALARNGFVQGDPFVDPEDGLVWYWERVVDAAAG